MAAAFARAVVPGSYLIISCGSGNRSEGENFATEYTAARIYIHLLAEILGFFDGFRPGAPWRGRGAALVRRRPGPWLGRAHRDLPRRRGPQAVMQLNLDAASLSAADGPG